jgi:ketosteroid isomerase-like protein
MASENVDLVRSILADWERGDYRSVEWADPELEFVIADGPAPATWKGLADTAKGFREILDAWEDLRDVVEEYREIDHERVLVPVQLTGRGRTSGVDLADIASRAAYLFRIRDGKVTNIVIYMDRDRALADLGLKE